MKSPNNVGDRVPIVHLFSSKKIFSTRTGFNPIKCWPKGSHENPQTTSVVAKTVSCSLQTDSKSTLLKTTLTEIFEHGEVKLVST